MKPVTTALLIGACLGFGLEPAAAEKFQEGVGRFSQSYSGRPLLGDGGLYFLILTERGKTWPALAANPLTVPEKWRGFPPQVPLGTISADAGQPASFEIAEQDWVRKTCRYTATGGQAAMELTVSRLSPAVLFATTGKTLALLKTTLKLKKGEQDAVVTPKFLAWAGEGGAKVGQAARTLEGKDLAEAWLLLWYGPDGLRPQGWNRLVAPYQAPANRDAHLPFELPLLLVLERRPQHVVLNAEGLRLEYAAGSGQVALLPLFGMERLFGDATAAWKDGLPETVLTRCRRWARWLRSYPLSVTEEFAVDSARGAVRLRQRFTFLTIQDDWRTPCEKFAPLPPPLAIAWKGKLPVVFTAPPQDMSYFTNCGPLAGIPDADEYACELPGILKYLDEKLAAGQPPPEAAPLQEALEKEIGKMLAAGHLQPFCHAHHLAAGVRNLDFWANPGQLVYTLGTAMPFLPQTMRAQVKEYLLKEIQAYPPWKISHVGYGKGRPRGFFDIPPEELKGEVAAKALALEPQGPATFDTLYSLWAFGESTGDWTLHKEVFTDLAQIQAQGADHGGRVSPHPAGEDCYRVSGKQCRQADQREAGIQGFRFTPPDITNVNTNKP